MRVPDVAWQKQVGIVRASQGQLYPAGVILVEMVLFDAGAYKSFPQLLWANRPICLAVSFSKLLVCLGLAVSVYDLLSVLAG